MPRPATPSGPYFGAFPPIPFKDGAPVGLSSLPRDEIVVDGKLYMERYYLSPDKSRRLHHILLSDPGTDLHDHPWDFVSVLLTGSYRETTLGGDADYSAPCVIARKAEIAAPPHPARRTHVDHGHDRPGASALGIPDPERLGPLVGAPAGRAASIE